MLIVKPLAAIAIVAFLGYPGRTALTVALGLAQIGEFSFILAQVARDRSLMPEEGVHLLVATAMITITLNPLLFRALDPLEAWTRRVGFLNRMLNSRADRRAAAVNAKGAAALAGPDEKPLAIIVGYGPVGRLVDALLRDAGLRTVVVDMNIETIRQLFKNQRPGIYVDATRREVLGQAGIGRAVNLVITLPHTEGRTALVRAARELNPTVEITVRARYLAEREPLEQAGANTIVYEEGESGVELARGVMNRRGLDEATVERMLRAVRTIWKMDSGAGVAPPPPREGGAADPA